MKMHSFFSRLILCGLCCIPSLSMAILCPRNFNQVAFGDTIEQVIKQCGNPDNTIETKKTEDNIPQEWNYYIPQTVNTNTAYQAQGTLKTSVTFDKEGKAINISVNGLGVGASSICGNMIQLGDTRKSIESTCGKPAFINKQQVSDKQRPPQIKVTEFIYNTTPPVHFIFEDGKLTER